jgi:hypothetical protein
MWSWVLATIGLSGLFLIGSYKRYGWIVLMCNEAIWVAYALRVKEYGFILMAGTYAGIYVRNYRMWGSKPA